MMRINSELADLVACRIDLLDRIPLLHAEFGPSIVTVAPTLGGRHGIPKQID